MSNKRSNKKFIGGLAVACLLPFSFWIVYTVIAKTNKNKLHLPERYIADKIDSSKVNGKMEYDTTFHTVGDVALTNQLGHKVSLNNTLKDKILVVDFFFVNCPTICPRLTGNMAMLQGAFKRDPKKESSLDTAVQFISITVNPEHDSFPVLRSYADKHGADHDRWWFLTGDKKDIYNYARNELFVAASPGDGGADDFIHTEKIVLIDKHRNIRGYYDGFDTAEIKRCADDIVLLAFENERKKKK